MSHKPDTTRCWMGNEYHMDGVMVGIITHDGEAWHWFSRRYNTSGLCHTRERAQWWVEHYANKMGA